MVRLLYLKKIVPKEGSYILLISLLIVLLDQLLKYLISKYTAPSQSMPVIGNILYITYVKNTGAGFGILRGWNSALILASLLITGAILFCFRKIIEEKQAYTPIALIVGGAAGNLLDRVFRGYVIDFIDFKIWPAFNAADIAVTIGALWLLYLMLFTEKIKDRR